MALFPFVLVKTEKLKHDEVLIRHETIHLRQAVELLVIPFYLLYLLNYIVNRVKYKSHHTAYMNIAFEREAYSNEQNTAYLKQRKLWAWMHCFSRKRC